MKPKSEEQRRKTSERMKGNTHGFSKGHVPFNKGIKQEEWISEDGLKRIREARKGQPCPMKDKHHSEGSKEKIRKSRKGKGRGVRNGNWKGGVTSEQQIARNCREHEEWSLAVKNRDKWTCKGCGTKKRPFVAHHIMFFPTSPELRYFVSNGQTLCVKCHRKLHRAVCKWNKEARIIVR